MCAVLAPLRRVNTYKLNGSSFGRPDVDLMFAKWGFNNVPPKVTHRRESIHSLFFIPTPVQQESAIAPGYLSVKYRSYLPQPLSGSSLLLYTWRRNKGVLGFGCFSLVPSHRWRLFRLRCATTWFHGLILLGDSTASVRIGASSCTW